MLSRKPPTDPHGLFELDPPKEFTPALALRDRLAFVLRANPVVATKAAFAFADQSERSEIEAGVRLRGKKVDVIMRALHGVPRTIWDEAPRS